MSRRTTSSPGTLAGVVVAIAVTAGIWLFADQDDKISDSVSASSVPAATVDPSGRDASPTTATDARPDETEPISAPEDGIERIAAADLPAQAHDTLGLIDAGGPFPYRHDDQEFQNREGSLPDRPPGYYREYTVETPGSDDRGARRIITGDDGEIYYTDDHYESFRRSER